MDIQQLFPFSGTQSLTLKRTYFFYHQWKITKQMHACPNRIKRCTWETILLLTPLQVCPRNPYSCILGAQTHQPSDSRHLSFSPMHRIHLNWGDKKRFAIKWFKVFMRRALWNLISIMMKVFKLDDSRWPFPFIPQTKKLQHWTRIPLLCQIFAQLKTNPTFHPTLQLDPFFIQMFYSGRYYFSLQ